jgi:hypothetical protein
VGPLTDRKLLDLLARVAMNGLEGDVARRAGLSDEELDVVLRYLEQRHAVVRRTIAGEAYVYPTIEMDRVKKGLGDDAGFEVLRFRPPEGEGLPAEPLARWPAIAEALAVASHTPPEPASVWNDDQLELVDDAIIQREQEALMVGPDPADDYFEWESREVLLGPLEQAVARTLGPGRWAAEEAAFDEAIHSAVAPLTARSDAWGDDAFLDFKLVALGRALGDAGRRTIPEAILRAYRLGSWPRFYVGAYPFGRILCVAMGPDRAGA